MSGTGPQLPPHLAKRKRTPDDGGEAPSKRAPINHDEIRLGEESSEDEFGPSIPKSLRGPLEGPSTGPAPQSTDSNEITLDDNSNINIGPAPAPVNAPRRVVGPAPPPAPLSERPPESDSDSDDDYGPSLPTSNVHLARQSQAQENAALKTANPKAPQRDDWMLVPPTASGPRDADPTKIKARKFNSGPKSGGGGGGGAGGGGGEISSIWTETPEQKRQRLENAVLGRGDSAAGTTQKSIGGANGRKTKEEQAKADQIRANLEAARGPSLYAKHQQQEGGKGGRIEVEEDDPSKRGFDWEKDMRSGSKIGTAQRKELMNKAADFGGRFSKGKYL